MKRFGFCRTLAVDRNSHSKQGVSLPLVVNTHIGETKMPGPVISAPEITHVSKHGLWLLLADEELLLSFEPFPWFRRATIEQISRVEWPTPEHLYWPELDIDLSLESVRRPEAFPLVSKGCN